MVMSMPVDAHAPPSPLPPSPAPLGPALGLPDPTPPVPSSEGTPAVAAAPPAAARKGRGAGKRLTDRERLAILEELDKGAGVSNADVARRYGVTRAAVQKLKAKGAEIKARYRYGSVGLRDGRKRGSHSVSVPFERELFEWVRGLKARKVPVPPSLVKEKAKLLVPKYNLGDFQASNGWYYNFCRRFSLTSGVLVEDKPADPLRLQHEQHGQQQQLQLQQLQQQQQQQQFHQQLAMHGGGMSAAPLLLQPTAAYPAAATPATADEASKSDRILELLEKQAALIDRQTRVSEQQADTMKRLLAFLVTGQTDGPSANI